MLNQDTVKHITHSPLSTRDQAGRSGLAQVRAQHAVTVGSCLQWDPGVLGRTGQALETTERRGGRRPEFFCASAPLPPSVDLTLPPPTTDRRMAQG